MLNESASNINQNTSGTEPAHDSMYKKRGKRRYQSVLEAVSTPPDVLPEAAKNLGGNIMELEEI